MKAVIMAGGEGSRLRPITCDIPKPMARLCGRPVVEYILDLLLRHGLQDATLTLKYLPEVITRHFCDEVYRGMPLRFVEETEPLGTAGSVKNAMRGAKEAFLVMSGDALCDYDLSAAIRFHQKSGGAVTMITAKVGDPREYGLVRTGENGVVTGFLEKPGWGQAVCDVANTGIYILEPSCLDLIPDGKPFDFAKDLFPLLMERGEKISAYTAEGYWCDIGDLRSYLTCQQDMLHGRVKCAMPAQVAQGIYTKDDLPREDYQIIPPVYIGERVDIAPGAVIGPDTILDDGALVENNAKLHGSLLLPNAKACRGSAMRGAILGTGATLKHSASLFENAVVGAGALIGAHSSVRPGVLVWPGKTVGENLILSSNVKFDSTRPGLFDDTGVHGEAGDELTPELCARLGAALGSTKQGSKVGIAFAPGGASKMLLYALQSGLMSVGSHVWNFGTAFPAQLSFFTAFCGLGLGIFVDADHIHVVGQQGLPLPRYLERDIEARFARGEFNRAAASQCREAADMSSIHMIYARQLSAQAGTSFLSHLSVQVECESELIRDMLEETLCRLGCLAEDGGLLIWISSGGETCTITEQGRTYTFEQLLALCCQRELSSGHDVAVPYDAPWALGKLEQAYHHKLYRYLSCPADQSDREAREESANEPWVRDGLFMAVRVLGLLNQEGVTLRQAMAEVPEFCVARRQVPCTVSPARLMHALQQELNAQTAKEGVLVKENEATVYISPSRDGGWLKLMVEAANMETATELCAQMEEKLVKPQLDIMKEKK